MMKFKQQIERIKEKLALVKQKDASYAIFGAKSHQYKIKKPLTEDQVLVFEKLYKITLPEDYVAFITQIGNQGKKHPKT